jgi:hypothetical protein
MLVLARACRTRFLDQRETIADRAGAKGLWRRVTEAT